MCKVPFPFSHQPRGQLVAFSSFLPPEFHQCLVSGDPHYRTFDHFVHHFQGRATYALTQTLGSLPGTLEPFSVAGRNRRRFPFHRFSFLREVYVSVYGYQVTLMQGRKMAVSREGALLSGRSHFHTLRDSLWKTKGGCLGHLPLHENVAAALAQLSPC